MKTNVLREGWLLGGALLLGAAAGVLHLQAEDSKQPAKKMDQKPQFEVQLPDEAWKQKLTLEQYAVARQAGTERPFGKVYQEFEAQGEGDYHCVCCGVRLFTSKEKFHSGCGWPSFYDDSADNNVLERVDDSHGMRRVETVCKRCGAHLGHVFDGESISAGTPTNRRFCINGVAIVFVAKGEKPPPLLEPTSKEVKALKEKVAEGDKQ
ncbi:MAG: peptide-methionine (R)-S-oxide reductase MsrB [Verrucomicrobiales bacterium]|nr:peptide-methionine (R)-S-oxide reductase MsrB [Verrucomicrobiales bacterium]